MEFWLSYCGKSLGIEKENQQRNILLVSNDRTLIIASILIKYLSYIEGME